MSEKKVIIIFFFHVTVTDKIKLINTNRGWSSNKLRIGTLGDFPPFVCEILTKGEVVLRQIALSPHNAPEDETHKLKPACKNNNCVPSMENQKQVGAVTYPIP